VHDPFEKSAFKIAGDAVEPSHATEPPGSPTTPYVVGQGTLSTLRVLMLTRLVPPPPALEMNR